MAEKGYLIWLLFFGIFLALFAQYVWIPMWFAVFGKPEETDKE